MALKKCEGPKGHEFKPRGHWVCLHCDLKVRTFEAAKYLTGKR